MVTARLRRLTSINHGSFPFTYLRCPVFYGRKNKNHFKELLTTIAKRMLCLQNKFLSFRGTLILISNELQSIAVNLLSTMNPPKRIIDQLHQLFARFFWGKTGGNKGIH